ncbi:MAG: imidazole glycerol phosphate synthase subunit HisF [Bacteriovorax sp.]|nr:imidazole glycerol phosphate synthase subunit HisF [Bacteriovorax sp.]
MLRTRVIPIVLLSGYSVLKTIKFDERRNLGNPITIARIYNTRNVDELVLLDIDASKQKRAIDFFTIQDIASECFMPLTVGGGIRKIEDIRNLLKRGADKISINTYALENPDFISESAAIFGSQCIVVSIDLKKGPDGYFIYSSIDNETTKLNPIEWCKKCEELGAGELLVNFVDLDGTMAGVAHDYINQIANAINIPLIASGGVAVPEDAVKIAKAGASGVGISSIFHFTNYTPLDCKIAMNAAGILVKI